MLSSERIFTLLARFPLPSSAAPSVSPSDSSSETYVQNFESYELNSIWTYTHNYGRTLSIQKCIYVKLTFYKYTKYTDYKLWDHELKLGCGTIWEGGVARGIPPPQGKMLSATLMVPTLTHINPPIYNKQDIIYNVHVHVALQFYTYVATFFFGDMDSPRFFWRR